ncbi:hypothetical protein NSE01_34640 [Novosphingobium sediminis]|uniref:Uncharacterized protein n=1 Tax=Novosphingobium sediminis TaxID=707214 RepID=A0A512APL3_9SPHN|nr:hypothetical protein NSE01_34640 [Novosphingobium sediminis]
MRARAGYRDPNKMRVDGKGAVDCVALWDDCDIKQHNYRWQPHKVWKVTKIGRTAPFMQAIVAA